MSLHDDDILDFDFFDDEHPRGAGRRACRRRRSARRRRGRWRRRAASAAVPGAARGHAAPPAGRARRVRDPRRRPARALGAGLLGRPEAQRLLGRDDAARRRSARTRPRSAPTWRAPHDARAQADRARDVARGLIERQQQDVEHAANSTRRARCARRPITPSRRWPARQRHAGPARHVPGDEGRRLEERDGRRREARRAGAPARGERRRLAGALPRTGPGDDAGRGRR